MSISLLLSKQNADGGWPYVRGKSWTEPTAYAVMALLDAGKRAEAERGIAWLRSVARPDGGWPPQAGVDQSTWVTGLVALLPAPLLGDPAYEHAIGWLTATSGHETSSLYRMRQWLLGNSRPPDQEHPGWPWVPGAAAWVGPTSIAMMALDKAERRSPTTSVRQRLEEGRRFLLARMCQGGGWNHGSARPLGYDSRPYPETTGMALAALRGAKSENMESALVTAQRFLAESRSADALNWLQLGLLAHHRLPHDWAMPGGVACRTLSETALGLLVAAAKEGRNAF
jgi:hypothetical protein